MKRSDVQGGNRHRLGWLPLVGLLLLWTLASGCDRQGKPAEEAAEAFSLLMQKADWVGVSDIMHPEALAQVRELAEVILAADPMRQDVLARAIFDLPPDLVKAIPDADLLIMLLRRLAERKPELVPALAAVRATTLGHVRDGSTVHVVARMDSQVGDRARSKVGLTSLRQHDGQWKVLLADDVSDAIEEFRQSIVD